ncbi:hypothetical protein FOL46_000381, partial [Perkinsus olseni]
MAASAEAILQRVVASVAPGDEEWDVQARAFVLNETKGLSLQVVAKLRDSFWDGAAKVSIPGDAGDDIVARKRQLLSSVGMAVTSETGSYVDVAAERAKKDATAKQIEADLKKLVATASARRGHEIPFALLPSAKVVAAVRNGKFTELAEYRTFSANEASRTPNTCLYQAPSLASKGWGRVIFFDRFHRKAVPNKMASTQSEDIYRWFSADELEFLENRALEQREDWARAEDSKLTTGLAKPELCAWGVVHGPHSEMQAELNNILTEAVDEVRASPAGKFLAGWVKLSREDQANFSDSWTGVEEEIDRVASRMRDRWCQALGCSNRQSLSGSPLRVPLLKSLLSTWRGGAAEDESILDDVDSGVNIGVRYPISRSHIWPEYSGSSISDYYTVSSFEKDAFVNYVSAEENPEQVERELEKAVMKGHMVEVGEELPPGHEDAVVSRVASIPKASGSWLIIELDAKEAFKHLRISSLDEVFVYSCAPGSKTLYRHLRLAFGCISSPLLWVNRVLCAALQLQCIAYIDDTSFISNSQRAFDDLVAIVLLHTAVGVISELRKARASRTPRLLGFQCDLSKEQIDIPQDKLSGIAELGETVLAAHSRGEPVRVRCVETLLGKLMWASQSCINFRCHLGPVFAWCKAVKKRQSRRDGKARNGIRKNNRDHTAYLGRAAQSKIRLLLSVLQCEWLRARSITSVLGRGLLRGQSAVISDASLEGFGGTCCVVDSAGERHRWWFAVSFDDARALSLVKAVVPSFLGGQQFTSDDVSCLELVALVVGLLVIPREYTRLPCTLLSDNTSAVAAINRSYSLVPRMALGHWPIYWHVCRLSGEAIVVYRRVTFRVSTTRCVTASREAPDLAQLRHVPVKVRGSGNRGIPTVDAETVQTVLGAARAQPTNRKYDSILSGHSLAIYISALTREGKVKAETIEDYVGKLRCVGKQFSEGLTGPESELVRLALQGSKRILGWSEPVRARTLSATELATLSKLEPSSGRACAVAAYLVGVCGLLRLREVAELRVSDVEWRESQDSRFAVLNVRHSKTDQRAVHCHGLPTPSSRTMDGARRPSCGPLFGASYEELDVDIRELVAAASNGDGRPTSHSMRRTGCSVMLHGGVLITDLIDHGRWASARSIFTAYGRGHSDRLPRQAAFAAKLCGTED